MHDTDLSRRLLFGLGRLSVVMRSQSRTAASEMGLTGTQREVLLLLERRGGVRLGDVADEIGVSAASASETVSALVERDLVEKCRDPKDRRALQLALTDGGREAVRMLDPWPEVMRRAADSVSEEDRGTMLRVLCQMILDLERAGAVPLTRMCLACANFQENAYPGSDKPHHCGFLDRPVGDAQLQLDCPTHRREPALA